MRTLTGLSGEYVTFDYNAFKMHFEVEFLLWHMSGKIGGFDELVVLIGRLNESGMVNLA